MNYFNYFTEIEETFIQRRGKHLLLSPLDWALIESWQERGIPLRIVLRGIENVFDAIDKSSNRQRTIKSLTYCREEVETQYAEWLETQVGKSNGKTVKPKETVEKNVEKPVETPKNKQEVQTETVAPKPERTESALFPADVIESHLTNLETAVKHSKANSSESLRLILDKVSKHLLKIKETYTNAENLEESLTGLESSIDKALLANTEKTKLENLKKEIETRLANQKTKVEKEIYERTFDLMLLKRLREEAEIPPFSLFYL